MTALEKEIGEQCEGEIGFHVLRKTGTGLECVTAELWFAFLVWLSAD